MKPPKRWFVGALRESARPTDVPRETTDGHHEQGKPMVTGHGWSFLLWSWLCLSGRANTVPEELVLSKSPLDEFAENMRAGDGYTVGLLAEGRCESVQGFDLVRCEADAYGTASIVTH
jgi:hypothetical protein